MIARTVLKKYKKKTTTSIKFVNLTHRSLAIRDMDIEYGDPKKIVIH